MSANSTQKIVNARRDYNTWVATETLEDYALRFAPKSFRKWSELLVANTALGGISFLALEAIGGSLAINYGFANSFWAIAIVSAIIFLTGLPITYYAAKYNIDMDLLTRGAGFGYIGSTITSLIYASFTFIFFALEAAIMAQAIELYFGLPLPIGYVVCSLIIIPLVFFGVTLINKLQLWTQPLWLFLMISPYIFVLYKQPEAWSHWLNFAGRSPSGATFNPILFGAAATVSFSLIAQIGEQVDYLRFLPEQQRDNRFRWWFAVILAGPGWILLGGAKQLGGAFLASLAVSHGVSFSKATEPIQMYLAGFESMFDNPEVILAVGTLFVIVSQIKINVTNAYAGSLAWSNFFSRLTHSHPGRVVWLVFNVAIALLLMELGVFATLEQVLGLYSNVAIAWVGALVADLVVNKPLGLSPSYIEFKRAHLYNINPVGFGATLVGSGVAIAAFVGVFGPVVRAYSPFVALGLAFVLSPILAVVTGGKYYIARENVHFHPESGSDTATCCICNCDYELEDMAFCPVYDGAICSLCCSLDARCEDGCKPEFHSRRMEALLAPIQGAIAQKVSPRLGRRLLSFLGIFLFMALLVGALFGLVYYQTEFVSSDIIARDRLPVLFAKLYAALLVLVGIGAWWWVLTQESRQLAREELDKQNLQLQLEIRERQQAETALRQSEAQLKGQTQQLETTLQELRDRENQLIQSEKMAALGGLVAGIAHEVNTPLGISITATSTLVERLKTFTKTYESGKLKRSELEKFIQTARQSTNAISGNLDRAAELIQSFKQVAVDRSTEERRAFNFKAYLEEILLQLRPKLKQTNHRVRICGADDLVLYSYPGAWSQIITNLVINSLVHAYEDGNSGDIEMHFQTEGDRVVFCYRDDGCGIDKDNLNRIFEPFFTTKRGLGGSGLGLHVTYNLVTQKLDGTIECNSEPGVGTAFILTLPNPDRDELN
jgi:signal transduction histidine kinase/purine-cytosine permease-like protein